MAYALERRLFGVTSGNFLLLSEKGLERFHALTKLQQCVPPTLEWIYAPRLNRTNEIAKADRSQGSERLPEHYKFSWTPRAADGMVLTGPLSAVVIPNADNPTVTLWQEDTLAHLHCGFRNLICETPNTPSIVEVAVKKFFDRTRVRAVVGHGIGSCCWAPTFEGHQEIWQPKLAPNHAGFLEECIGRTTRGPFGNMRQTADLYKLARLLLLHVGVLEEHIEWDTSCTCCALSHGRPVYWSQTRHRRQFQARAVPGASDGRNASLAWLTHGKYDYPLM